jgi:hypothetical protein
VTLRQPALGLAGLLLVVPTSLLLAFGAGGAEPSLRTLGPIVTFALPAVAMIAFWWDRWPGSLLRPGWAGLTDTVLIAVAAVLLSAIGRLITGPAIDDSMRLAVGGFVWMLQLTLVCERWPLRGLRPFPAGLAALGIAWALALVSYVAQVPSTLLLMIGVWQTLFFIAWHGWPLAGRLVLANAVVLGGAVLTYAAVSGLRAPVVADLGGSFIASALIFGILFDGWITSRAWTLVVVVAFATGLYMALAWYAGTLAWTDADPHEWVAHAELNALGVSVIAHVAIGRRWPFVPFDLELAAN